MKKYNLINNSLGWLAFLIAAITYMMTLEPTASFWDCGEFIAQGCKLEVGHPPGNPIFMLAARFFINFAPDTESIPVMVNAMSALLSAGTILLLFWTITHLVKRLLVKADDEEISWQKMAIIMGSGMVGALAYTWSDTFWYSAVEGEVYAFSSFCTALTFWLILKWEARADKPNSDRYLIAIAYTIGVSVAVHLLNLLCIPAIVLVFYYRKFKETNVKGSLIALLVSFVIIVLILYGLVPGFVEMAQHIELLFVNELGFSFNSGAIFYAVLVAALFSWSIYEFYVRKSEMRMKLSFLLSVIGSGMFLIGDGFVIGAILTIALAVYLFKFCKKVPVRIMNIIIMSIAVIFIGYSSYALILIRSNAHTPIDQNSPDNMFALAGYLNREQYGKTPLLYGPVYSSSVVYEIKPNGTQAPLVKKGKPQYRKTVKKNADDPDHYTMIGNTVDYETAPEMNMLFPRLYSANAGKSYSDWLGGIKGVPVEATVLVDENGKTVYRETRMKPTFLDNMSYFISYQLNYMYWRYFMWNFSGRQNDIQGHGEISNGNWISGIPFIDNARLGDQSTLPDDYGAGNAGHNVFYMLPLIFGIIGLLWQAYHSKRGIEQFWVVFFLFFMTGIAIVIYLNQTPGQPRERDYAYAGSFYAFAIWIGLGVAGLCNLFLKAFKALNKKDASTNNAAVVMSVVLGLLIPLQMVSQTWDDHDRSGRYAARDFGMNYLESVEENGIIFTNGDNDTFPLWYAQEVENCRTDVRVVNLSYLSTDWYINQLRRPTYESEALPMLAPKDAYSYDKRQFNYFIEPDTVHAVPADVAFAEFYSDNYDKNAWGYPAFKYPMMYVDIDKDAVAKNRGLNDTDKEMMSDRLSLNMLEDPYTAKESGMTSSKVMTLDIISQVVKEGWKRPIYFAMTVPESYYAGLMPYMASTGMAYEVKPFRYGYDGANYKVDTEKAFRNITEKFRWGGLDKSTPEEYPYLDETVRRMVTTTQSTVIDLAFELLIDGMQLKATIEPQDGQQAFAKGTAEYATAKKLMDEKFGQCRTIMNLLEEKMPTYVAPYTLQLGERVARLRYTLGEESGSQEDIDKANELLHGEIMRFGQYSRYCQSLTPSQYRLLANGIQYADTYYLVELISLYCNQNENAEEAILKELADAGVDMQRVFARYPKQQ